MPHKVQLPHQIRCGSIKSSERIQARKLAFTVEETMGMLSIGRTTLYARIKSGEIQARKCGRKTLILAEEIERFLDGLDTVQVTPTANTRL